MFHVKHSARDHDGAEDWRAGGFGLYFHWPFCLSKCPYCDFNSHVSSTIDHAAWARGFAAELQRTADLVPDRMLNTIYFGGGTPSLMRPELVAAIVDAARKHWRTSNDVEITLEANPTSVEAGKLRDFRAAGVNRVSMGLQALNDVDLRRLGRTHDAAEGRKAFELACSVFDRVSFDLIYARQYQSLAQWDAELREALAMQHGHISMYQLTIEDGTVFGRRHAKGGLRGLPSDDLGADFYDLTQDRAVAAGLPAYEVSNHAAPGQESRHNLVYWNSGDYAGIGPGAHGRLTIGQRRIATAAARDPSEWLGQAQAGGVQDFDSTLDAAERATEFLLMGLRLQEGIDLQRFEAISHRTLAAETLSDLTDLGLIEVSPARLQVTEKGRPLLNAVLLKLIESL